MSLTLDQRREILASMPWVAVSPGPGIFGKRCEGYRSDMPLHVRNSALDRSDWACKNRARWVFLGLDGRIQTFCWWHLFIEGFQSSPEEVQRYQRWLDEYMKTHPEPPAWDDEERDEPLSRQ